MLRKTLLPTIFILLTYGFWISPDFKEIAAGVAIFLFGMLSLDQGFKSFAGGALEIILKNSTSNVWKSIGFGTLATTLMQSSTLVSVITISFLSAGLIKLGAGIGIIFGANLGTTTGAWLIAGFGLKVKISAYALPMLVFGVMGIFQKSKSLKGFGYILTGLGFLFLGIHHMKDGFEAFKSAIDLTSFAVSGVSGLLIYCALGILATVIMQSSHATLVLTLTALATQQITYENSLSLAIGANIGTTITAILGSLSAKANGKRLAAAHLLFNLVTGIVALLFIHPLMQSVDYFSQLVGIASNDFTLKLATFHTLFNLIGIVIMLPFIQTLERTLIKLIKEHQVSIDSPKFLVQSAIEFPDTAVEAIRNETLHLYQNAIDVILRGLSIQPSDLSIPESPKQIVNRRNKEIVYDIDEAYMQSIKGIYSAIVKFISLAGFSWEMIQSSDVHWLRLANQRMVEAIKDIKHLRKNLIPALTSSNLYIVREYNEIRCLLFQTIREIESLRKLEEDEAIMMTKKMKKMVQREYNNLNKNLSELIQENRITPESATSLMNDCTYAYNIAKKIVKTGETLFVYHKKQDSKKLRKSKKALENREELVELE